MIETKRKQLIAYYIDKGWEALTKAERISAGRLGLFKIVSERDRHLRHRYGIREIEYDRMLNKQDGKCAICRRIWHRAFYVDHDHATGEIRGLLCAGCNTLLGSFERRYDLMANLFDYLFKSESCL